MEEGYRGRGTPSKAHRQGTQQKRDTKEEAHNRRGTQQKRNKGRGLQQKRDKTREGHGTEGLRDLYSHY